MTRGPIIELLVGILIIILAWFGVWGLYQKSSDLRASIGSFRDSIDEERVALAELAELENLLKEREPEIAKLKIAIPPERDIASLIAAFEEAASINGLALTALDIFEPDDTQGAPIVTEEDFFGPTPLQILNARIELSGRYGAFQSFLADIELSFPLVDPTNLSFRPPAESDTAKGETPIDPILDFVVSLEAYYID